MPVPMLSLAATGNSDDDDCGGGEDWNADSATAGDSSRMDSSMGMVAAPQTCDKISIRYATRAPTVDVKALKEGLWKAIEDGNAGAKKAGGARDALAEKDANKSVDSATEKSGGVCFQRVRTCPLAKRRRAAAEGAQA